MVFEDSFVKGQFVGCFNQSVYVVVKKVSLYVYSSRKDYLNEPNKPLSFFNLNSFTYSFDTSQVTIADSISNYTLTHEDPERLQALLDIIEANRGKINLEKVFPKKFKEIETRRLEKLEME